MGLANVVFRSLASLVFTCLALFHGSATSTGARLGMRAMRPFDPGSPSQLGLHTKCTATRQTMARCTDGPEQHLAMRHVMRPLAKVRALKPCSLKEMPRSCRAISLLGLEASCAEQSPASLLSLPKEAATKPGTWAPAGRGSTNRGRQGEEAGLHGSPRCSGHWRSAAAGLEGEMDRESNSAVCGPLFPTKMVRGADTPRAARRMTLPSVPAGFC